MKKLISLTAAAAMLFTAASPVFADNNQNIDEILAIVKSRIGSTDKYEEFNSSSYENERHTEYSFNWSDSDSSDELRVNCNDLGIITGYMYYSSSIYDYTGGIRAPKLSREEAINLAEEFIAKLNPEMKDSFTVSADEAAPLEGTYWLTVSYKQDGYKVNGGTGSLTLNGDTGEISRFSFNYHDVSAPEDPSKLISADAAKAAFKEQLGMKLVYSSYYDDDKIVYYPVYKMTKTSELINAETGKAEAPYVYNHARNYSSTENAAADSGSMKAAGGGGFSKVESSELEKIAGLISKTDTEKAVRNNEFFNIGSDLKLISCNLERDYIDKDQYIYSLRFENDTDSESAYVSVSANDGSVLSYSHYSEADYRSAAETEEKKRDTELEDKAVKALAGDKLKEFRKDDENDVYCRYVNDIPVENQTISATAYDGKLTSYRINYEEKAEFPSISEISLDAAAAADKLFEASPYEIYCYEGENGTTNYYYNVENTYNISPFTGKPVDYRNEEIKDTADYIYTDIDGHYAKEQIEALAQYGIGLEGSEFKPDSKITVGEFAQLLSHFSYNAITPVAAGDYLRIKNADVAEDFSDTTILTRENAAVLMVKAIDADKYADYDIYITPFKDVTAHKGYIALLYGMGIVHGDQDMFYPDNEMTRAEAAVMIYNYLTR